MASNVEGDEKPPTEESTIVDSDAKDNKVEENDVNDASLTTTDNNTTSEGENSSITNDDDASSHWELRISRSRKLPYYYNRLTKASTWESPKGVDPTKIKGYEEHKKNEKDGGVLQQHHQIRASHLLVKHKGSRRPTSWKEACTNGVVVVSLAHGTPQATITRSKEEALELIENYRNRITFEEITLAELAQTESDCSSAKRGGDLGHFGKGQMQPTFEEAAFKLEVGQLSEPVWSDSGVHLILRTEDLMMQKGQLPKVDKEGTME
ncbi:hypothetical protein G9A89_010129 [Geosiphon pyriformis]|nr:hypothetical protein G9A89_010129 [Geosiphon pyriformis]